MLRKALVSIAEKILPASFYIQHVPDLQYNNDPDFKTKSRDYNSGCDRLTRDGVRVLMIKYLMDMVSPLPVGDYAELGTFQGNFAKLIFRDKDPESTLYCFDTFEGFDSRDVKIENDVTELNVSEGRFSNTNLDRVRRRILGKTGDKERLKLVKGYFPASFQGFEKLSWRFVHLDADLYEPIKEGLRVFWPKIIPGGILLVHDYNGGYIGTRKAVDEFFTPLGIRPIPMPDKTGSALIIKSRTGIL